MGLLIPDFPLNSLISLGNMNGKRERITKDYGGNNGKKT